MNQEKRKSLRASVQIEAAIVFPILILLCVTVLGFGFRLAINTGSEIKNNAVISWEDKGMLDSPEALLRAKWILTDWFSKKEE